MMRIPRAYLFLAALLMAVPFQGCRTASTQASGGKISMKLGIVMTTADPETVSMPSGWPTTPLRTEILFRSFLLGKGVELDQIHDQKFDVQGIAKDLSGKGWQSHGLRNVPQAPQFGRFGTVPTFDPEGPS